MPSPFEHAGTRLDAREASAGVHRQPSEGSLSGAVGLEGVGVEVPLDIRSGLEGRQSHELLRTGDREPSQDDCVEQAADCHGRAENQHQRDDDDQGKSRSPPQTAEGLPNVKA